MPEEKENFEQEAEAVKEQFRRLKESNESRGEHAERLLKTYLKQALGPMGSDKRKSIAKDMIRASKENTTRYKKEFGNDLIDEPDPTGFEPKPWDDENE